MTTIFTNKRRDSVRTLSTPMGVFLFVSVLFPTSAFAYVDPGSGSVIVTTILGLIAAIGYTFRKYFYKLKRMISGKYEANEDEDKGQDGK